MSQAAADAVKAAIAARHSEHFNRYSIELDCPPGSPRPDDLFPQVIEGTGLTVEDFQQTGRFFGNWTWVLKEESEAMKKMTEAKPLLQSRVKALYAAGTIRYGSW